MRDDFLSPTWADHHRRTSGALHTLFTTIGHSLARLNAYQFDAPWKPRGTGRA